MAGLELSSAPAVEPLTLAQAKLHLRFDAADEDVPITALIVAARRYVEKVTRRQLVTATYKLYLETLSGVIRLPRPPLQSVTTVNYVDLAGATQTASSDDYTVNKYPVVGTVGPDYTKSWPTVRGHTNDVTITYKAGYGDAGTDVPDDLKQAMKLLIGHWFEHREAVVVGVTAREVPTAAVSLIWPYRVFVEV